MSRLRRYYGSGKLYFVTNVTFQRKRILVEHADLLHHALTNVKERLRFEIIAHVILPDHFHAIIDPGEYDLSNLLQRIKQSFSMDYRQRTGASGRVWQLRFWDHIIRDQDDMNKHIDYIHYNPVKMVSFTAPLIMHIPQSMITIARDTIREIGQQQILRSSPMISGNEVADLDLVKSSARALDLRLQLNDNVRMSFDNGNVKRQGA